MPVRRVVAHERVEADRGRVALQRGPIVYAAEWPDNPNGKVRNIVLPPSATLTSEFRAGPAQRRPGHQGPGDRVSAYDAQGTVMRTEQDFVGHSLRDVGEPRPRADDRLARHARTPSRGRRRCRRRRRRATVTTSPSRGAMPARSTTATNRAPSDRSGLVLRLVAAPRHAASGWSTPSRSRPPSRRSSLLVRRHRPRAGARAGVVASALPETARRGSRSTRVTGTASRRIAYNTVTFAPVTTTGLRLEVTMQPEFSAGIQEWRVE